MQCNAMKCTKSPEIDQIVCAFLSFSPINSAPYKIIKIQNKKYIYKIQTLLKLTVVCNWSNCLCIPFFYFFNSVHCYVLCKCITMHNILHKMQCNVHCRSQLIKLFVHSNLLLCWTVENSKWIVLHWMQYTDSTTVDQFCVLLCTCTIAFIALCNNTNIIWKIVQT